MKKTINNDTAMLDLITKMQAQLTSIDSKIDSLIKSKCIPDSKPLIKTPVSNNPSPTKSSEQNRERFMHKAICADCQKECTIPFKPSGDRPVYCKDCFSRRKVISMSRIGLEDKPKEFLVTTPLINKTINPPKTTVLKKKKPIASKKPITKKKVTAKKK